MFKSITHLRCDKVEGKYNHIYWLEDTDFQCEVAARTSSNAPGARYAANCAILLEYQKRNLPVAKNLALRYLWLQKKNYNINTFWINFDLEWIEQNYPELEYTTKYYPCVLRQFEILKFSHR